MYNKWTLPHFNRHLADLQSDVGTYIIACMCDVMSSVSMIIESIMEWTSVGVMVVYCCIYIHLVWTPPIVSCTSTCKCMSYIDSTTRSSPALSSSPPTNRCSVWPPLISLLLHTPVILAGGVAKQCQATRSIVSGQDRHQLVLEIENSPHSC